MRIEELVIDLCDDPFNPEKNFHVAVEYQSINQTASAVSFYLRCAEYGGEDNIYVYNALLKLAQCFDDQNDRVHTVTNCILQAASYMPNRPEAYFLMSQFYEHSNNWQECYTWASMGLFNEFPSSWKRDKYAPLPADIGYRGAYCLEFEKAIAGWWVGRNEESTNLLLKLYKMDIAPEYKGAVKSNLERIGVTV